MSGVALWERPFGSRWRAYQAELDAIVEPMKERAVARELYAALGTLDADIEGF